MPLTSTLFKSDPKLEACLINDSAHIKLGAIGEHVGKIQTALSILDGAIIDTVELESTRYGPSTAEAVLAYKKRRTIVNLSYQNQADDIVGKMTIKRMDDEMAGTGHTHQQTIDSAFNRSRASLRVVLRLLQTLQADIDNIVRMEETGEKSKALADFIVHHARDMQVISRRLLVSSDPLSSGFREALAKTIELVRQNLGSTATITDQGATGRCNPALPSNGGLIPNAATTRSDPEPRVSVCTPFFTDNDDLQRDVVTHEFFHLLGLVDHHVATTNDALTNANTIAQIVALLNDRFRQRNSDGNEAAVPPLPAP